MWRICHIYEGRDWQLERKQKKKGTSIGYLVRRERKSASEDVIFMVRLALNP